MYMIPAFPGLSHLVLPPYYKIQETLFNVDFQIYNRKTLAVGYFVDKHDMKRLYMLKHLNKNHRPENIVIYFKQQGLD